MQPEKKEARGLHPSGLQRNDDDEGEFNIPAESNSQRFLASHRARLDRLTDDLAAIADWKDELQRKIRIAQLKFELVDCFDTAEHERLEAEVRAFKETCARLGETVAEPNEQPRRKVA
jgi:hypothetical protein